VTTKKIIGKLHLWLGLASGLVVIILGVTGCMLAFEYELKEIIYKDRYFVHQTDTKRLPLQHLLNSAQQALGKGLDISGITVYKDPNRTTSVAVYNSNPRGWNYFNTVLTSKTVYLNPYTAKVQYIENSKTEFFRLMVMLHYNLLLEQTGHQIVGWCTLIFIVLLISGLVLWWPKNKAAAKKRFAFRWKEKTQWKRKNYDLHNILGFYSMILALIIALTGLVWAFSWFNHGMQWIVNGGFATPAEKEYLSDSSKNKSIGVYDIILKDMQKRATDELYSISIPKERKPAIYAYSQTESSGYKWTTFSYDQYTGKNLSTFYYKDRPSGDQLRNMNYYIHTGAILSLPGKILAFIVSFICAGLPLTGFYIWIGRNRKKK